MFEDQDFKRDEDVQNVQVNKRGDDSSSEDEDGSKTKARAGLNSLFASGNAKAQDQTQKAFGDKVIGSKKKGGKEKFSANAFSLRPNTRVLEKAEEDLAKNIANKSKGIKKNTKHEITKDEVKEKLKTRRMAIPARKF